MSPSRRPVERLIGPLGEGSALRAAMAAGGRATRELACAVGLQARTVACLRAGRAQPTTHTARVLAGALGVPVAGLFPEKAVNARARLAAARLDSGLTWRRLARQARVGIATIEAWNRGITPRAEHAEAVAAVLGKPVEGLFTTIRRCGLVLPQAKTLAVEEVLAAPASGEDGWEADASCATGHDRQLWFPETVEQASKAREVCAGCPVAGDCRDAFLAAPVTGMVGREMDRGIWAGLPGSHLRRAAARAGTQRTAQPARPVIQANPQRQRAVEDLDRSGQVAYRGELWVLAPTPPHSGTSP